MKKILYLTLLSCFLIFGLARSDNYPRDWNVDVVHYTFNLTLSDASNRIEGQAIITVRFYETTGRVRFDLIGVNNEGKGMNVSRVLMNGNEVGYKHNNNKLVVTPDISFSKGSEVEIEVFYSGIPVSGLIIGENKYGDRSFFGDNWPDRARNWLPSVDHLSDKASVDFVVTAPEHYKVIGNGIKVEESNLSDGLKLTHWKEVVDISTKVMVIGAARFATSLSGMAGDIRVEAWVYPQNREEGFHDYAPAVEILSFFDSLIGPYSYKKLANVQSKTTYGGMENASNIFYYENSVTGKGGVDELIAHEVAHQWFGNSATEKDWHHVWLSEGFATYLTKLYIERFKGTEAIRNSLKKDRETVINYYNKNPAPIVDTKIENLMKLLNSNSYQKGGWVLHMLRRKLGDEVFYKGIRAYYLKYQNSNALTKDLVNEMEVASGKQLDDFFNQWVFTAGQPDLDVEWSYNKKGKSVDISIEQLQDSLFEFSIDIEINGKISTKLIHAKKENISIEVSSEPKTIELDPETWLLYTATVEKR